MEDQLEKFIKNNREAFDSETPNDQLWEGIDRNLGKKRSVWSIVWKVAAMFFMASTIYLMVDRALFEEPEKSMLSDEFIEAEGYYVSLIAQRKQAIREQLNPEQHKRFLLEVNQLDSMYLELKETHQTNIYNDRVLDAMINNLQLRLNILNKQLNILHNIKKQSNGNDISIEI